MPIPSATSSQRATRLAGSSRTTSVRSITGPSTSALANDPSPGRWRSGIQASRINSEITIVAVPMSTPVCRAAPWASTVQGELPRFALTSSPSPIPNRTRPAISVAKRRGDARQREGAGSAVTLTEEHAGTLVREDVRVDLAELVATSETVAATAARGGKVAALVTALRDAGPDEVPAAVAFLSGELRQRQIGVGWAALRELPEAGAEPSLTVADVDSACEAIGALSGPGSRDARRAAVNALFARATRSEQRFLRALLAGEL